VPKNLQLNEISKKIHKDNFPEIGRKLINYMVVDHSNMHEINYKEKKQIESKLRIKMTKYNDKY
jgi:hypothetical protein